MLDEIITDEPTGHWRYYALTFGALFLVVFLTVIGPLALPQFSATFVVLSLILQALLIGAVLLAVTISTIQFLYRRLSR
tara:strand:+ start:8642 stop:8878 length:237 start_codon:yes stop_codon:yes gene_type:complete